MSYVIDKILKKLEEGPFRKYCGDDYQGTECEDAEGMAPGEKKRKYWKGETAENTVHEDAALAALTTVGTALWGAIIAKIIADMLTKAGRTCSRYRGNVRKACFAKFKKQAYLKSISTLKAKKSACDKAKDKEKCLKSLEKKIKSLQKKADAIYIPQGAAPASESIIEILDEAEGWSGRPKGWTQSSVKKFAKSLTGKEGTKKDFFDRCVKKMKGKVDDPNAFCAGVKDELHGSTYWRGKGKSPQKVGKDVKKYKNVKIG